VFPTSIDGHYEIGPIEPGRVHLVVQDVAQEVLRVRGSDVERDGESVSFRGGFFRSPGSWRLFSTIDRGIIRITAGSPGSVDYSFSTRLFLIMTSVALLIMSGSMVFHDPKFAASFLFFGWLWAFGMNYVIARFRLSSFVREILPVRESGPLACPDCGALYDLAEYRDDATEIRCRRCHSLLPRSAG